ncbi:hypothetical protein CYLTODRAFT_484571 [Cylindrobasidium torrendii FP15055 ss-10]|uniref:TOG domain-containing protein n=1 Tax=Cylindrobasidium torrendii FP15055 ss-10 TaxID=1314674 RepID=A0A0D7BX81_9AGAR|nr:hypothetical protein CYLTODRAFT_484571 [Cylindrobasidium torrendii FP15055 ss-10]
MALKCTSAADVNFYINDLSGHLCLAESEETWDKISGAIAKISSVVNNGGCDYPDALVAALRPLGSSITGAMKSERTRLSGTALDFVAELASNLGPNFEPLIHTYFPVCLALCARTNKVVVNRSRAGVMATIECTQHPSVFPYIMNVMKDKSASLRIIAAESILACLNCFNPPDLEKDVRARDIELFIKNASRDANADVRKIGKKIFDSYKTLLPDRVDSFTAPLTPTIRKFLNVTGNAAPRKPAAPSAVNKKLFASSTSAVQPSTTTSSLASSTSNKAKNPLAKSASSTLQSTSSTNARPVAAPVRANNMSSSKAMPPPAMPARPTLPPKAATTSQPNLAPPHRNAGLTRQTSRAALTSSSSTTTSKAKRPEVAPVAFPSSSTPEPVDVMHSTPASPPRPEPFRPVHSRTRSLFGRMKNPQAALLQLGKKPEPKAKPVVVAKPAADRKPPIDKKAASGSKAVPPADKNAPLPKDPAPKKPVPAAKKPVPVVEKKPAVERKPGVPTARAAIAAAKSVMTAAKATVRDRQPPTGTFVPTKKAAPANTAASSKPAWGASTTKKPEPRKAEPARAGAKGRPVSRVETSRPGSRMESSRSASRLEHVRSASRMDNSRTISGLDSSRSMSRIGSRPTSRVDSRPGSRIGKPISRVGTPVLPAAPSPEVDQPEEEQEQEQAEDSEEDVAVDTQTDTEQLVADEEDVPQTEADIQVEEDTSDEEIVVQSEDEVDEEDVNIQADEEDVHMGEDKPISPVEAAPAQDSLPTDVFVVEEAERTASPIFIAPHQPEQADGPNIIVAGPSPQPSTPRAEQERRAWEARQLEKTPITSLLASIEQGFMFTPGSPLSPPASYLNRSFNDSTNLGMPFPLTFGGDGSRFGSDPKEAREAEALMMGRELEGEENTTIQ